MKGLWERWERCSQGTRRFDNYYHEVVSLARQLDGITPQLIYRKLKATTEAEVRYKEHEKASRIAEGDYEELARVYSLADEAIRELAKEKKVDSDKKDRDTKPAAKPHKQPVVVVTITTTNPTESMTITSAAASGKKSKGKGKLEDYISPEAWSKLTVDQKRAILEMR